MSDDYNKTALYASRGLCPVREKPMYLIDDIPQWHTPQTQDKIDRAAWIFHRHGIPDPPKKRPFHLKPFRYINAIPE